MSVQKTRAAQLLDNPLLGELFNEYERALYERWLAAGEMVQQTEERAKARALRDVRQYITNKCEGILSGH